MSFRKHIALILLISALLSLTASAFAVPEEEIPAEPAPVTELPQGDEPIAAFADPEGDEEGEEGEEPPEDSEPKENYYDIINHWAESVLTKAIEDELLRGFSDGTVRPDTTITTSQMITVLTRVLGATQSRFDNLAVPSNVWYYKEAGLANYLGLIDPTLKNLDVNMTRQDAFALMARAFSLTPAAPDLTVLNSYSDFSGIKAENKAAMAAMVSAGLVQGFGGSLNVNGSISRAEFVTVLYRIVASYVTQSELASCSAEGGVIVRGDLSVSYAKSSAPLWLDCSSETVSLRGLTTDAVTLKSHELKSFDVQSSTKIGRLVIDCGSADIALGSLVGVTLETVQLQSGGSLTVTDSVIKNIEITGDNQTVSIAGAHEKLIISGSHNTVILESNAAIGSVVITGNQNDFSSNVDVDNPPTAKITGSLIVAGYKNTIGLYCAFEDNISIEGDLNQVSLMSNGNIKKLSVPGSSAHIYLSCNATDSIEITGNYNTFRKESAIEESLVPLLNIAGANNYIVLGRKNVIELMTITGAFNQIQSTASMEKLVIDGRKTGVYGTGEIKYLILNATGCTLDASIINFEDNSKDQDVDRILGLVSYTYRGNYTLQWALENDYEDYEKEIFVNAKGYSSKTEYLLWINLAMQRVNIFKGSQGNWTLEKTCLMGSGAPGSGTPVGVYYTTYKLAAGWTTGSYTCKPVVGFKQGSGYAFHSRLYYPNSSTLKDPSIGFPVSAGCIRMYDEDINYIYNEIPLNTTVVVY